jgi:hypothetical protein
MLKDLEIPCAYPGLTLQLDSPIPGRLLKLSVRSAGDHFHTFVEGFREELEAETDLLYDNLDGAAYIVSSLLCEPKIN